ncbi:MAG TPA: hypothetical protein VM553_18605, partial [Dongiaceae bacterium]|nr:hypothetical protein [Dongiaceae bacterium]
PTVASLSAFLIQDMFPDELAAAEPVVAEAKQEEKASEEDDQLDDLSQDELAAMLAAELGNDKD